MSKIRLLLTAFIIILPAALTSGSVNSRPASLLEQLQQTAGGNVTVQFHTETGGVRFIGANSGEALATSAQMPGASTTAEAAWQFLEAYGAIFGLQDANQELEMMRSTTGQTGQSYLRYQQVYQGVPVLGGELIVSTRSDLSVTSASGEIMPALALDVRPAIASQEAIQTSLEVTAKTHQVDNSQLDASEPELWVYDPALLGAPGKRGSSLVWRVEVRARELQPIRELVLVDAHLGVVRLNFNQVDTALYRAIHDKENVPDTTLPGLLVRLEGGASSGIRDVDLAYQYSGDTYYFYYRRHQRDGIDDKGMQIVSTVRYCPSSISPLPCPYPNAFWNGKQMVYGEGFVADDVVAHELTHGVTEHTSRLFYYMQSGAINEAFSDIWGEFVDLTNGLGNDSYQVRWLMGEDLPSTYLKEREAVRSMKNPPLYNQPDRMSSPLYWCSLDDNGGVHYNSGVANKAAYLMTDGGIFNGKIIQGIGLEKTATLFYEAQNGLLTSASDYGDLYSALLAACSVFSGTAGGEPGAPPLVLPGSSQIYFPMLTNRYRYTGITASDCQQVKNALDAVEMYSQPTSCAAPDVPLCQAGSRPAYLFSDDLENITSGNWSSKAIYGANAWYYPQTASPYGENATYATSGRYNFLGVNLETKADFTIGMNHSIALPAGKTAYLHFKHAYDFELGSYDGGVLEYSLNSGLSWHDAGLAFSSENGYRGIISPSFGNPLAGRQAFVNSSYGYISSRYNLGPAAGQDIRFRYRIGTDEGVSRVGWFIDDISIYTCDPVPTPTPTMTPTQAPATSTPGNSP